MVGNVLGALHGTKTLKNSWQQEVEIADVITELAKRLAGTG
jgi:ADP-ribosylglycohydrolase